MPIYDYKCNTCGKSFEYQQKITEDALTSCPPEICSHIIKGKGEVQRVISKNVGLIFKGSGFYLTDYTKKTSPTSSNNGSEKSETITSTKNTAKTESE